MPFTRMAIHARTPPVQRAAVARAVHGTMVASISARSRQMLCCAAPDS